MSELTVEERKARVNSYHKALVLDDAGSRVSKGDDSDFGDMFTYGLTGAIASGMVGIANTGISFGNMFGGDSEHIKTKDVLDSAGLTGTSEYYDEHEDTIDAVGFGLTAIIPGMVGVKALRMAQAGLASSATSTSAMVRGMGKVLVPSAKGAKYLENISAKKVGIDRYTMGFKAAQQGFHQAFVESAFAEVAILATTSQNPSITAKDTDYIDGIVNNLGGAAFGLSIGTGLGGVVGGIMINSTLKKTLGSMLVDINVQSKGKLVDSASNSSITGDIISIQWKQLDEVKNNLDSAKNLKGEDLTVFEKSQLQDSIKLQEKNLKDNISKLVGDTNKKGVPNKDRMLTQLFIDALEQNKVTGEDAFKLFANMRSASRHHDLDLIMDPTQSPLMVAKTNQQYEDIFVSRSTGTPVGIAKAKANASSSAGAQWSGATDAQGMRGIFIALNGTVRTQEELYGTLLHEFGHDLANRLAYQIDIVGIKKLREGLVAMSKDSRKWAWDNLDYYTKSIADHYNPNSTRTVSDIAGMEAQLVKSTKYLNMGEELMADAWKMFNLDEASFFKYKKAHPQVFKFMNQNNTLKNALGLTDVGIDLKTLKPMRIIDRAPTVADIGRVHFNQNNGVVTYQSKGYDGKLVEKTAITKFGKTIREDAKDFDPQTMTDAEEASAIYYASMHPKSTFHSSSSSVKDTAEFSVDIPRMTQLLKKVEGMDTTKQTLVFDSGTAVGEFKFGKGSLTSHTAEVERLRTFIKSSKERVLTNRRNRVATTRGASDVTDASYARIIDVSEKWAQTGGIIPEGKGMDKTWLWSHEYRPDRPTMLRAKYKVKSELADRNNTTTIQDVESRHQETLASNFRATMEFNGTLDPTIAQSAPNPTFMTGLNGATDINEAQGLGGIATSVSGEYGEFSSFVQGVANFNEKSKVAMMKHIDDAVQASAVILKSDKSALQEAATLDGLLRKDFYKFASNNYYDELLDSLPEDAHENLELIFASIKPAMTPHMKSLTEGKLLIKRDLTAKILKAAKDPELEVATINDIVDYSENAFHSIQNDKLATFWRNKNVANDTVIRGKTTLAGVRGMSINLDEGVLYPGAYDIKRFTHVKFVHAQKGLFKDSRPSVIGASTKEGLEAKEAHLRSVYGDKLKFNSVDELQDFKSLRGDYDERLSFGGDDIDSELHRQGVLADMVPEPSIDLIDHYVRDMKRQAGHTMDGLTVASYSDEFAALEYQTQRANISTALKGSNPEVLDNSRKAMNIMLNKTSSEGADYWKASQQGMDKVFSTVMNTVGSMAKVSRTDADFNEMNKYMESAGLPKVYDEGSQLYLHNNHKLTNQMLAAVVPRANALAATFMLRLDAIQPLVTAISTPITALPELAHLIASIPKLKQIQGATESMLIGIPRAGGALDTAPKHSFMSNAKLAMQAVKDYWKRPDLVQSYHELGFTPSVVKEMRENMELITLNPEALKAAGGVEKFKSNAAKVVNTLATPADKSEGFVKFVAARMADLALEAHGITDRGARILAINTYVKRVHGNYTYAQRPKMFQGFAGQAIGLFQTYQFNMIQQFTRHLGDKNVSSTAAMVGLQSGIFGTQSVPGFQALNAHIGERSREGNDFYTGTQEVLGKEGSDWLLYGVGSNFTKPVFSAVNYITGSDMTPQGLALFTRGDMTPRTKILLPTSFGDIPSVNLTTKFVNSVLDGANAMTNGVPVSQVFADALAKNGVNRPLSGLGQLWGGAKTTSKGTLIAAQQDLDWWQGLTKLAGTSTLDEALATQHYYRSKGYQSWKRDQLNSIGATTKTHMRSDNWNSDTYKETMDSYVKLGGDYEDFAKWSHDQFMGATESQITNMRKSNESPQGKYLQKLMGADISPTVNNRFIINRDTFE